MHTQTISNVIFSTLVSLTEVNRNLGRGLLSHYHKLPSYHPVYLDQHGEYEEQYSLRSHVD